jgi:hypothetical protein
MQVIHRHGIFMKLFLPNKYHKQQLHELDTFPNQPTKTKQQTNKQLTME